MGLTPDHGAADVFSSYFAFSKKPKSVKLSRRFGNLVIRREQEEVGGERIKNSRVTGTATSSLDTKQRKDPYLLFVQL